MFLFKKYRDIEKTIKNSDGYFLDSDGNALITVKASSTDQIFSRYEYDSGERLNNELATYIEDKAKLIPSSKDIKIKIYTDDDVDDHEIETAIRTNFKSEFIFAKNENLKNWIFAFAMFVLGLISLSILFLSIKYLDNQFIDTILEIVAWVFWSEMTGALFLTQSGIRIRMIRYLKLYNSKIEIVKLENIDKV